MIEDAERSGNSHDPNNREHRIEEIRAPSAQEHGEKLRANSAD